uniref:flagellar export chaperone FliS n=1 Tax=Agathobacter sp. TaxID=2021311 RepID=UPI004057387D
MENRLKQDFTRRLSQCNKGELIVIMYDIVFAYMDEAKAEYEKNNYEAYKTAIRKASVSIDELIKSLDFSYDVSKQLYPLYMYSKGVLAKAIYQNKTDGITQAENVLRRLYSSFKEAAKSDTSGPLMRNTQKVYAGITYGKNDLNESYSNNSQRGFLV